MMRLFGSSFWRRFPLKRLGLRSEIVLQLSVLMAAALLLSSVLILKFYEQEMLQQQIDSAISKLRLIALQVTSNPESNISSEMLPLFSNTPLTALSVRQENNPPRTLLSSGAGLNLNIENLRKTGITGQFLVEVKTTRQLFGWEIPKSLEVTVPLRNRAPHGGALQGEFSLAHLAEKISSLHDIVLTVVGLFGLTLTLFGSYLLGTNVVKPILALEEASKRVAEGDLEQRLNASGSRTLSNLAKSFNAMILALREAQSRQENHITELENLNLQLQRTRDDLIQAEKMSSLGHLAAGMAHEIGNPLGALIGYLELIRKTEESTPGEIACLALAEAGRIDQLVRDLLDYARPVTDHSEVVDARDEIVSSRRILIQQGACPDEKIVLQLPDEALWVKIPPNRLQQVMINLLRNALDAARTEDSIWVEGHRVEGKIRLTVNNRGESISEDIRNSLFDPFFTTKGPDRGRGLGLFVCHNIVRDVDGTIDVLSSSDGVNTFSVTLPATGGPHGPT